VGIDSIKRDNVQKLGRCYPGVGAVSSRAYCFNYAASTVGSYEFALQRSSGRVLRFGGETVLTGSADNNDRVNPVLDPLGNKTAYQVYSAKDNSIEIFDLQGLLQTRTSPNGKILSFYYSDDETPLSIAPSKGLLTRVSDNFGHELNFTYHSDGRMANFIDTTGGVTSYGYDESSSIVNPGSNPVGNLTSVTYPDRSTRLYW
jgi:YD repeat-containing protein